MKLSDVLQRLDRLASKTIRKKALDASRLVIDMSPTGALLMEVDLSSAAPKVRRFASIELDASLTEAERKNAFSDFLLPLKRGDPPNTTFCWSEGMTFRQLSLPEMPTEDLLKALLWELKKKYYFNPDENLFGYKEVMDVEGAEGPEKLYSVFYCEKKSMLPRLGFVQSLGLEVDCFVPGPVALAAFAAASGEALADKEMVVCHLSEAVARILVVRAESNLLVRHVTLGVSEGVWPDETLSRLVEEIRKTIDFYESQKFARAVGKVLFTGSGPEPARLVAFMASNLGLPVALPNLESYLPGTAGEQKDPAYSNPGFLCTALGAALVHDETLNLVPSDIKNKNLERKMHRWLTLALVGFGVVLFCVTGLTALNVHWTKGRLKTLESEYAHLQQDRKALEELLDREKLRRAALEGDIPLAAFLKDLSLRAPSMVALQELRYNRQEGSVTLKGIAADAKREGSRTVSQFTASLTGSAFYKTAEARGVEQDEENKAVKFQIEGTVKGLA